MAGIVQWLERRQVALYLAAIGAGALVGWLAPAAAPALSVAITPVLALLLFATFLGVPLVSMGRSFLDLRFLVTVLTLNFVVVPVVVFGLSRFVAADRALLLGVLLVLLTPCVDYVIVFTGLAGGARDRLLAAAPLLMLLQILLLPVYLWLFAGPGAVALIEVGPFVEAFLLLIVLPLAAAARCSSAAVGDARRRTARAVETVMQALMVPLMMVTLAVVVGSQIAAVGAEAVALVAVLPVYLAFLVIMVGVGLLAARLARLDVPAARALVFSGATRNSLVVLPLALALPAALALAPLAVVTQTLVELVGMVILVRLVPRLVPAARPGSARVSVCDDGHDSGKPRTYTRGNEAVVKEVHMITQPLHILQCNHTGADGCVPGAGHATRPIHVRVARPPEQWADGIVLRATSDGGRLALLERARVTAPLSPMPRSGCGTTPT